MKNQIRPAYYYQLAFKNNLQLTEVKNEVALLGDDKDWRKFNRQLEEKKRDIELEKQELIDEKINDEIQDNLMEDYDELN